MAQSHSENKLGTMPIGRLLVVMSIPMMISMFIQALYNIVDSMFVSWVSENALTAVSLAFPMQNVITAIGVGTGVGINALVPRHLGQGRPEEAEQAANVAVFLSVCYCVIFLLVGVFAVRPFYEMQTDVPEIVEGGVSYLSVVCMFSCGAFFGQNFEKLLVATGNATLAMVSQATGAVINLCFDPLLIFGYGPFPRLGITGAAVATVFGQIVAAAVALVCNHRRNHATRFHLAQMRPTPRVMGQIYAVGIPSMITVGLGSAMAFCVNQIFLTYTTTATAVFGVWQKLQNFGFMPVFGLNNGTIPILSYNQGAGKIDRVRRTIRLALTLGVSIMVLFLCMFELIPAQLLTLFNASDTMRDIGMRALRICCLSFPLGGACVILSSAFQALGYSRYTLAINFCRQLLILVPAAWVLSVLTGKVDWIWVAWPIAETGSLLLAVGLYRRMVGVFRKGDGESLRDV